VGSPLSDRIQKTLRAIDLNLLPILRELLYTENVSKAAQRLNMSQPAVSEALSRLRVLYEDEILVRAGRKMVATPFAKRFIVPLDEILGKIEGLSASHEEVYSRELAQDIVIATGDSAIVAIGSNLVEYLKLHMPNVNVEFIDLQNFDIVQLKSGEVDLAIMPQSFFNDDGLSRLPLYQEDFVVISRRGHPQLARGVTLDVLKTVSKVGYKAHPDSHLRIPPPPGWQEQVLITQMALLPYLVERSDSIALIQRHVAMQFDTVMGIEIHEIPNFDWTAEVFAFWGPINQHALVHKRLRESLPKMLAPNTGYRILS
jgi:DNA-binding transcriptional LysR family regulator